VRPPQLDAIDVERLRRSEKDPQNLAQNLSAASLNFAVSAISSIMKKARTSAIKRGFAA